MPNVYTRTGDKGDTGLFGGSRVPKQSLRVEAYGTVDEANAALGAAKAMLPAGQWRRRVHDVQQRLFVLAAELASDPEGAAILANKINTGDITDLEHLIDDCLAVTGPQREFVVPGRGADEPHRPAAHLQRGSDGGQRLGARGLRIRSLNPSRSMTHEDQDSGCFVRIDHSRNFRRMGCCAQLGRHAGRRHRRGRAGRRGPGGADGPCDAADNEP